jgi:hypothetical protein
LWGPDELEKMKMVGNHGADGIYGAEKIDPSASKEQKQRYVVEKYEKRSLAGKSPSTQASKNVSPNTRFHTPKASALRSKEVELASHAATDARARGDNKAGAISAACKVPDSFFDDIFNEAEDSYFGSSTPALKSNSTQMVQVVSQPPSSNDDGLDAFLNSTLKVQTPQACSTFRSIHRVSTHSRVLE